MAEPFIQRINIQPADIDELGHVNNVVYLRWAQEIAIAHWQSLASAEMLAKYVWVVARHEIDYRAPLMLGDVAEARTWVEPASKGALWLAMSPSPRLAPTQPCAEVVSSWCLLDAATRRVKRVPAEIVARFT